MFNGNWLKWFNRKRDSKEFNGINMIYDLRIFLNSNKSMHHIEEINCILKELGFEKIISKKNDDNNSEGYYIYVLDKYISRDKIRELFRKLNDLDLPTESYMYVNKYKVLIGRPDEIEEEKYDYTDENNKKLECYFLEKDYNTGVYFSDDMIESIEIEAKFFEYLLGREYFIECVFSNKHIGGYEFAWRYPAVIDLLEKLKEKNILILGGDVYTVVGDSIEDHGENWYYNGVNVEESVLHSIKYIKKLANNKPEKYLFVVCFDRNSDYMNKFKEIVYYID